MKGFGTKVSEPRFAGGGRRCPFLFFSERWSIRDDVVRLTFVSLANNKMSVCVGTCLLRKAAWLRYRVDPGNVVGAQ